MSEEKLNLGGAPIVMSASAESPVVKEEPKVEQPPLTEAIKDELPPPEEAASEGTVETFEQESEPVAEVETKEEDVMGDLLKEAAAAVDKAPAIQEKEVESPVEVPHKEEEIKKDTTTKTAKHEDEKIIDEEFAGLFEIPKVGKGSSKKTEENDADLLFNQVVTGTTEDVNNYVNKSFKSTAELYSTLEDETQFVTNLANANRNGLSNANMVANGDILSEGQLYKRLKPHNDTAVVKDAFTHGADYTSKDGSIYQLSGKKARIAVTARMRGIQKINLLNSGFYIIVRAPNLAELSEFTTSVDLDAKQFGRMIGNHFGLCMDVFTKSKIMELLSDYELIIDSNFPDITKKGVLAQHMSLLDFDVVLHGIISLMYRNGMRLKLVCPKCQNIEPNNLIDIASAKYMNTDLFTDKVAEYWGTKHDDNGRPIIRTVKDLIDYRRTILGFESRVVQERPDGCGVAFSIKDPSMARYMTIGEKFISKINATLHGSNTQRDDEIKYNSTIHLYQMFAPWVEKMQILNPDRSVNFETSDIDTIIDALDLSVQKDFNFVDDINKFVNKYKFDHIGTFAIECPKCHSKPELGLDDFYPLDVETIFFALACHQ